MSDGDLGDFDPDESNADHDTNHNLNESADKIRVNLSLKRGTDTRDQDSYDIKARGETAEEAAEAFAKTVAELEARDTFERVRNVQPNVEGDE